MTEFTKEELEIIRDALQYDIEEDLETEDSKLEKKQQLLKKLRKKLKITIPE